MSIASSSLSGTNQLTSLGLINGTGTVQSTTTTAEALAQVQGSSQGSDSSTISKGGQMMSQLSQLASSDPSQFKAAAQNISDQLAEAAKTSSDSKEASMLTKMSAGFADAAKTGSMDSLKPQGQPPSSQSMSSSLSKRSSDFGSMSGSSSMQATFSTVNNIISSALSSVSSGSSASTSTSAAVSSAASTSSTDA
jgi:hypothetical protein